MPLSLRFSISMAITARLTFLLSHPALGAFFELSMASQVHRSTALLTRLMQPRLSPGYATLIAFAAGLKMPPSSALTILGINYNRMELMAMIFSNPLQNIASPA